MRGVSFSLVEQSPYLFHDTIKKNIFLGRTPTLEEEKEAYELLLLFSLEDLGSDQQSVLELEVGEKERGSLVVKQNVFAWSDPSCLTRIF